MSEKSHVRLLAVLAVAMLPRSAVKSPTNSPILRLARENAKAWRSRDLARLSNARPGGKGVENLGDSDRRPVHGVRARRQVLNGGGRTNHG